MLLDQKRIAGVGNIYADEALFRARIHPLRPANRLTRKQASALRDAVVESLEAGHRAKGATIDDFRDPDGVSGSFQDRFLDPPARGRAVRALRGARCASCAPRGAGPTSASAASRGRAASAAASAAASSASAPVAVGLDELLVAAERLAVDDDLGERHHAGEANELGAALGVAWRG